MGIVTVNEENLTNIANAIREKNQTDTTYKPSEMAGAIQEIKGGLPKNGFVVNKWNAYGKPTDVSVIGITFIPDYYFGNKDSDKGYGMFLELTNVDLPDTITALKVGSFYDCKKLILNKLPTSLTKIESYCFYNNKKLAITEIPIGVTELLNHCCFYCDGLTELTCYGDITTIKNMSFSWCTRLTKFVLPNTTSVPSMSNKDAFEYTPIAGKTDFTNGELGYIYVKDTLLDSFKSATNWSNYADQIKPISELPTE